MELNFGAIRVGRVVAYLITNENADFMRSLLRAQPEIDEVLAEFEACYLPRFDTEGRQNRFGFLATLDGIPAGLSMLVVECWENARGYTGADAIPHMRGKGVTPGTKPHLYYLGFELLGLNRIYTGTTASNHSSRRSMEKTPGLVLEGVKREYSRNAQGAFEDEYLYAILKGDWLSLYDRGQVDLLPGDRPTHLI